MGKSLGLLGRHAYRVTPEVLQSVEKFASKLYTKSQISACLGISIDTFIKKSKESTEFLEAYERGWAKGLVDEAEKIEAVEKAAYFNATNPALDKDGNPVGPQSGIPEMQKFILKAKAGWNDSHTPANQTNVLIQNITPLFSQDDKAAIDGAFEVIDDNN